MNVHMYFHNLLQCSQISSAFLQIYFSCLTFCTNFVKVHILKIKKLKACNSKTVRVLLLDFQSMASISIFGGLCYPTIKIVKPSFFQRTRRQLLLIRSSLSPQKSCTCVGIRFFSFFRRRNNTSMHSGKYFKNGNACSAQVSFKLFLNVSKSQLVFDRDFISWSQE